MRWNKLVEKNRKTCKMIYEALHINGFICTSFISYRFVSLRVCYVFWVNYKNTYLI